MAKSICVLMQEAEKIASSLNKAKTSPEEAQRLVGELQKSINEAKAAAPTVSKHYLKQIDAKLKEFDISGAVDPKTGRKVPMEDIAAMIVDIGQRSGPGGISKFTREAKKATTWDMLMEVWVNGLLSGPQTHAVNTISNAMTAIWQIPERFTAGVIGKLTPGESVPLREALYQTYGMVEGLKDGFKAFGKNIVTGEESDVFQKMDLPVRKAISAKNLGVDNIPVIGAAVDFLGDFIRLPTRFLSSSDSLFKSIGYRGELRARAVRQGVSEGLSGEALSQRMAQILEKPPDDIHLSAIDQANYQTFTKQLGEAGQAGMRFIRKVPALRLIVPFIRTPTNIIKFAGERTPLAFASRAVWQELSAGGARRDLAIAKIGIGTSVMAIATTYAMEGKITGGGPKDGRLRALMYDNGWQPYSIKIGDEYYGFNRLEPLGMLLGVAADVAEISGQLSEEDAEELSTAAVLKVIGYDLPKSIVKNVTSKTWLKGASEAINAIDDPDRYGESFVANYAKSLVPAAVAQTERMVDPQLRSVYSEKGFFNEILNAFWSRVPGYSDELPPNLNVWGDEVLTGPGFGTDISNNLLQFVSPIYRSTADEQPINNELLRLDAGIGKPKTFQVIDGQGIQLKPKEYEQFVKLATKSPLPMSGKNLKDTLNELVTNDPNGVYKNLPDDQKTDRIRSIVNSSRQMALRELYMQNKEVQKVIDAQKAMRYMSAVQSK